MDQDIEISTPEIEDCLARTFSQLLPHDEETPRSHRKTSSRGKEQQDDAEFLSIFDSTSEYIITGNELAGKMINLSTHNMHILTLPEIIVDDRYERNNLLFCVGFVLRRAEDPRPFRPILSKCSMALRSTEMESQCLTHPTKRPHLQATLDNLLISLNNGEANMILDSANTLHLKLFQPPKPPAHPVPDHAVPILLRRDWQVQMYDWDLAINWVVLHIDGVDNAKTISVKSEVDLEMVRACLRVLKHHGVIAIVDMFFYSNRYEATERASALLAGNEPKLLQEAFEFCRRRKNETETSIGEVSERPAVANLSSSLTQHSPLHGGALQPSLPSSFPPPSISGGSKTYRLGSFLPSHEMHPPMGSKKEQRKLKAALAEWFVSFNRNKCIGDILLSKIFGDRNSGVDVVSEDRQKVYRHTESNESTKPIDAKKNGNQKRLIDWKGAFNQLDHRRVATFGVVHGLIRRVHNFPYAVENNSNQKSLRALDSINNTPKTGSSSMSREGTHRKGDSTQCDNNETLVSRVAKRMNGKICDDELVCQFDQVLEDLTDLVTCHQRYIVLPTYSILPEN